MRIVHTGDQGHELTADQAAELGTVDIILLAVGYPGRSKSGVHYRIDANVADALYYQLKPKVSLPGHYGCQKCTFRIATLDEFLDGKTGVTRLDDEWQLDESSRTWKAVPREVPLEMPIYVNGRSEVELKKEELPERPQIIALKSIY